MPSLAGGGGRSSGTRTGSGDRERRALLLSGRRGSGRPARSSRRRPPVLRASREYEYVMSGGMSLATAKDRDARESLIKSLNPHGTKCYSATLDQKIIQASM
eukprot:scaffold125646_cov30-Tisochrysis_lutea.AAC.5